MICQEKYINIKIHMKIKGENEKILIYFKDGL